MHAQALMHGGTLGRRNIAFRPLPIEEAIAGIRKAGRKLDAQIARCAPERLLNGSALSRWCLRDRGVCVTVVFAVSVAFAVTVVLAVTP
jgi:hypothetical protein